MHHDHVYCSSLSQRCWEICLANLARGENARLVDCIETALLFLAYRTYWTSPSCQCTESLELVKNDRYTFFVLLRQESGRAHRQWPKTAGY